MPIGISIKVNASRFFFFIKLQVLGLSENRLVLHGFGNDSIVIVVLLFDILSERQSILCEI